MLLISAAKRYVAELGKHFQNSTTNYKYKLEMRNIRKNIDKIITIIINVQCINYVINSLVAF